MATLAWNSANGPRLARQLAQSEAASIFVNGGLRADVIAGSKVAIPGSQLNNPALVKVLTADGSKIADWAKMTTQTFNIPTALHIPWRFPALVLVKHSSDKMVASYGRCCARRSRPTGMPLGRPANVSGNFSRKTAPRKPPVF